MRWIVIIVLFATIPPPTLALNQTECGLPLSEYNTIVEHILEAENSSEVFNILESLPHDLAECIEWTMTDAVEERNRDHYMEALTNDRRSPAALAVITDFKVNPEDITSVNWIQPLNNGEPLEEIEIVNVGEDTYYYFPEDGSVTDEEPPSITWTHEAR